MRKSKTNRQSRTRRWIQKCLLLAGLLALGIWAWSIARTKVFEDWESWAFDHQLRGERATVPGYLAEKGEQFGGRVRSWLKIPSASQPAVSGPIATPPAGRQPLLERNGLVGRLAIPRLHLSAMVREGTGEDTLSVALGHLPSTALPGQNGNVAVAGHRDRIFRGLRGIHENDLIRFETLGGNYIYKVETTEIVKPQNVSVLNQGQHPELTLITCYPFYYVGSAPDRFIVKARQVSQDAVETSSIKTPEEPAQPPGLAVAEHPQVAQQSAAAPPAARRPGLNRAARTAAPLKSVEENPGSRKVTFSVSANHSRQLAPGISFGLSGTDVTYHRVNGWMWVMPDRRTIWLRDQSAREPVIFYGSQDGRRHELVITSVTANSVAGYLLLPEEPHGNAALRAGAFRRRHSHGALD
jgi:sortase A